MAKMLTEITVLLLLQLGLLVTAQDCINGEVQLETLQIGGSIPRHFPQYCYNGEWRMFCRGNNAFPLTRVTESVICRQLGYSDRGAVASYANPVTPTADFVRPAKACTGTEHRIQDCGGLEGVDTCATNPISRVSIQCQPACANGYTRLVGGSTDSEGRVEVCMDGRWGTVCNNQEGLAGAVCAQMGFPGEGAQAITTFGQGFVPISTCTQNGGSLSCTQITDASCNHTMDLGVVCHTFEELYNNLQTQCTSTTARPPPICGTCPTCPEVTAAKPQSTADPEATTQPGNVNAVSLSCDCNQTGIPEPSIGSNEEMIVFDIIFPALGAAIGVLMVLLFGAVTALVVTCGALKRSKQTAKQNTPDLANTIDDKGSGE